MWNTLTLMKVYLHIATEWEFMDRDVQVAIECSAAPRIGDSIHFTDKEHDALVKAVIEGGKERVRKYAPWIYGCSGKYWLSFDDCIFVTDTLWRANKSGEFECHICLNADCGDKKTSDPPEALLGKDDNLKDYDYSQIIADYESGKS